MSDEPNKNNTESDKEQAAEEQGVNSTFKAPTAQHKAGFVNIIGRPNVGKSTLMNALVGERLAIITSKAQTTRHRIKGIVNGDDFQIVYSDTPGIIEPKYKMQESMMRFVKSTFKDADVMIAMVDIKNPHAEKEILLYADKLKHLQAPLIFLINKIDASDEETVAKKMDSWAKLINADVMLPISALQKINLDVLFEHILKFLPYHPPFYDKDSLTDRPERFFVSEIIREKILLNYKQEIPYSVEIFIESYKEEENIVRIRALILAERASQKPILIGRGGEKLKKVGTQSRKDIEAFIGQKVYLELFVKIRENWRNNDTFLKNVGYH